MQMIKVQCRQQREAHEKAGTNDEAAVSTTVAVCSVPVTMCSTECAIAFFPSNGLLAVAVPLVTGNCTSPGSVHLIVELKYKL